MMMNQQNGQNADAALTAQVDMTVAISFIRKCEHSKAF
jgi:hypothetical protein